MARLSFWLFRRPRGPRDAGCALLPAEDEIHYQFMGRMGYGGDIIKKNTPYHILRQVYAPALDPRLEQRNCLAEYLKGGRRQV